MELTWIEDFLALYRAQNFTEAAAQRCSTQSAFSRRIQQLEEWLGTDLFDRTSRPVQLTIGGEEFLRRATRIREDILDARRIAQSSQSHYQKTTRIYATTAIAIGIIPQWLAQQGVLNHSILTSSTGGSLEALRQKRADMIFLPHFKDDTEDADLCYEKIADDPLVLAEGTEAPKHLSLKDKTLKGPLLRHAPGTIFGQKIAAFLEKEGVSVDSECVCETSSAESMAALLRKGFGAAWLPQSLIVGDIKKCKLPKNLDVPCTIVCVTRRVEGA